MPEETISTPVQNQNQYLIPGAILIGFGFIAGAIFFIGSNNAQIANQQGEKVTVTPSQNEPVKDTTNAVAPVTSVDHIKGSPDAPIKIVEYSDFECPFCKRFHDTMNEVMKKYIESGEVAWVFRQFPLEQLHPVKAQAIAVASECANSLAGNDGFWKFTDRYFELTLTNNRTDIDTVIPQIASEMGLNKDAFAMCTKSDTFNAHIKADSDNAIATGGRGTPWSVVIAPNGKTFPLNGAQSSASVEQLIELARKEK